MELVNGEIQLANSPVVLEMVDTEIPSANSPEARNVRTDGSLVVRPVASSFSDLEVSLAARRLESSFLVGSLERG